MAALCFPNPATLRLALANGLVPPEVARAPAAAGIDSQNRIWVELSALLPRDALASLHRLGVHAIGKSPTLNERVRSWAELLPLSPMAETPASDVVLFVAPDRE